MSLLTATILTRPMVMRLAPPIFLVATRSICSSSTDRFKYQPIKPTIHKQRPYQSTSIRSFHSTPSLHLPKLTPLTATTSRWVSRDSAAGLVPPRVAGHSLLLPFDHLSNTNKAADQPVGNEYHLNSALNKLDAIHDASSSQAALLLANPPVVQRNFFQRIWHDYGWVGVGTYLGVYVGTLGMMFVAIRSGVLGADTVLRLVTKLGMESHFENLNPNAGDFIIAWIATKLTEPLRAIVTLAITPKLARMVGMAPPKGTKTVQPQKSLKEEEKPAEKK